MTRCPWSALPANHARCLWDNSTQGLSDEESGRVGHKVRRKRLSQACPQGSPYCNHDPVLPTKVMRVGQSVMVAEWTEGPPWG